MPQHPHPDDPCTELESVRQRDHSPVVTGRDVAMDKILFAMVTCGLVVGLSFPTLIEGTVEWSDGGEGWFRIASVAAGLVVGGFAYGVARFTLYRANQRLAQLAAIDQLTGLANQRRFITILNTELCRGQREGAPVSLLIADLDHFKMVNDTHGHLVGDEVLATVAATFDQALRPYDVACRVGGEEFGIILPGTSQSQAAEIAERLRAVVETTGRHMKAPVTVSLGVASYPADAGTANMLITRADDAMYEAKHRGRNQVAVWTDQCAPHPVDPAGSTCAPQRHPVQPDARTAEAAG